MEGFLNFSQTSIDETCESNVETLLKKLQGDIYGD